MHIDNSITPHQLVEWMGSATDERDGRILLGLLSREGVTDTDELTEDDGCEENSRGESECAERGASPEAGIEFRGEGCEEHERTDWIDRRPEYECVPHVLL